MEHGKFLADQQPAFYSQRTYKFYKQLEIDIIP